MVDLGLMYFDEDTYFPAVQVKDLGDGKVLVQVWTDTGPLLIPADVDDAPGEGVFVKE